MKMFLIIIFNIILTANILAGGEIVKCDTVIIQPYIEPIRECNFNFISVDKIKVEYVPVYIFPRPDTVNSNFNITCHQAWYEKDNNSYELRSLFSVNYSILSLILRYNNSDSHSKEGFYGAGVSIPYKNINISLYYCKRYRDNLNYYMPVWQVEYNYKLNKHISIGLGINKEYYTSSTETNLLIPIKLFL